MNPGADNSANYGGIVGLTKRRQLRPLKLHER